MHREVAGWFYLGLTVFLWAMFEHIMNYRIDKAEKDAKKLEDEERSKHIRICKAFRERQRDKYVLMAARRRFYKRDSCYDRRHWIMGGL